MNDFNLDILELQETCVSSDAQPARKADIAQPRYSYIHIHRETASRGDGLALVYRQSVVVKPHVIDDVLNRPRLRCS